MAKEEKRLWHGHVITARRLTESQFTELQDVSSAAMDSQAEIAAFVAGVIARQLRQQYQPRLAGDSAWIIPEAVHFNIEIVNVEEGRSL